MSPWAHTLTKRYVSALGMWTSPWAQTLTHRYTSALGDSCPWGGDVTLCTHINTQRHKCSWGQLSLGWGCHPVHAHQHTETQVLLGTAVLGVGMSPCARTSTHRDTSALGDSCPWGGDVTLCTHINTQRHKCSWGQLSLGWGCHPVHAHQHTETQVLLGTAALGVGMSPCARTSTHRDTSALGDSCPWGGNLTSCMHINTQI